jgi:hypothetical protein
MHSKYLKLDFRIDSEGDDDDSEGEYAYPDNKYKSKSKKKRKKTLDHDNPIEVSDPSINFESVGGLDHLVRSLKEMVFI